MTLTVYAILFGRTEEKSLGLHKRSH